MTDKKIVDPLAEDELASPLVPGSLEPDAPDSDAARADAARQIKELEHRLATLRTKELDKIEPVLDDARSGETVLIHFLEDGFTAFGEIWYRGQELEFVIGSEGWQQTVDRDGKSWLDLDDQAQVQRWGKVMFRPGPWPGQPWTDEDAAAKEQRRSRRVPIFKV